VITGVDHEDQYAVAVLEIDLGELATHSDAPRRFGTVSRERWT
jgi:hypothetical protein